MQHGCEDAAAKLEGIDLNKKELENCIDRLQNAFSTTMRKLGPELSEHESGLTGPQFFILNLLLKKGKCTVTELADDMRVQPSAITAMVDRLHKNGFVLRERDESDRRVVCIQLSDIGSEMLAQAKKKRKQIIQGYLSHLESEELESLVHIFEKLAKITTPKNISQEKE